MNATNQTNQTARPTLTQTVIVIAIGISLRLASEAVLTWILSKRYPGRQA